MEKKYVKMSPHYNVSNDLFPTEVIETKDQFGCYKLLHTLIHELLPPLQICNKSRIFCGAAAKNVLEVSIHRFLILYYHTYFLFILYIFFNLHEGLEK